MENCLPFDNTLAAGLVRETFVHMPLSTRYAGNSLSVSDAQVESKYSFWTLSNSTDPGKAADRKTGRQFFEHCRGNTSLPCSLSSFQWYLDFYQLHSNPSGSLRTFLSSLATLRFGWVLAGVFPLAQGWCPAKPLTEHHMQWPWDKKR